MAERGWTEGPILEQRAVVSPEVEGYAASWCRSEPERPGDATYMRGFEDGLSDKRMRDALYTPPSSRKTQVKPRDDQKISIGRRPAPPGARQGYKAPSDAQVAL
jgi:hypothetical protein